MSDYDIYCYELAERFLLEEISDDEKLEKACKQLATEFQRTAELFCHGITEELTRES